MATQHANLATSLLDGYASCEGEMFKLKSVPSSNDVSSSDAGSYDDLPISARIASQVHVQQQQQQAMRPGDTALIQAARHGQLDTVRQLLGVLLSNMRMESIRLASKALESPSEMAQPQTAQAYTFTVRPSSIARVPQSVEPRARTAQAAPRLLCSGTRVEAKYLATSLRGRCPGYYYPGTIAAEHPDGTVDIHYDDGDEEEHVLRRWVRKPLRKRQKRE